MAIVPFFCSRCGASVGEADEDIVAEIHCGLCSLYKSEIAAKRRDNDLREKYTPEASRQARKSLKWSQESLAIHLGISMADVGKFERYEAVIHPAHAEWLDKQLES